LRPIRCFPASFRARGSTTRAGLQNQRYGAELPYVAPKAAADASNAQTTAGVNAATAPAEITTKRGNALKSDAEGQSAQTNLSVSGGADNTQSKSALFYSRALKSNQFYNATGIKDDPQGREIAKTLLPDNLVNAFTSSPRQQAETAQRDFISATLRQESGAAIAPSEFENQRKIYFPQPGDKPETVALKAKLREVAIEGLRLGAGPAAPKVDQGSLATGPTRDVIDQGASAALDNMVRTGRSFGEATAYARANGFNPPDPQTYAKAVQYHRQHPEYKGSFGEAVKTVPTTLGQRAASSAPAAAVAATGNSLLGDRGASFIGAINGDPASAKARLDALRAQHPLASLGGDVAGQALFEAGLGRIPGAQALMASAWGRRGADALYGAYSGSGDDSDGNPLGGALLGAGANTLGGMVGRGAQSGVGRTLAGVKNAHLQYLDNRGIPLTLGQIARGSENTLGHAVGGIEERLAGLPVADAIIGTARKRGDVGFNKEMFGQVAPGVTSTGAEGLAQARAAEQAAYSKLGPVRIIVDPQFDQGITEIEQNARQSLLHHAGDVQTVINDVRAQINNGTLTGKGYQTALQAIRKTRSTLNDDVGGKAGDALDALESHVTALGERQGGSVGSDLAAANAIHGRIKTVEDALKKSSSQRNDELISPMTLNQSSIRNTEKFGGPAKALSDQRPFYELTDAGKAVMPNLTPDSGTAGRAFLLSTLFGGGLGGTAGLLESDKGEGGSGALSGAAKGLTLASLLAAPYSKAGQKIIQKTLLGDRPRNIQKLGDFLINNTHLAGLLGAGVARKSTIQH
jgi:hypothetical protein